ncbi:MAG: DUF2163 domain-containing protein [Tabrizicola sp.]|nr:DUF2163 domain-containing protein [Tabrizicola sp.]
MTAENLFAHLATGTTTVCRAWIVRRKDGAVLGFTDHDQDLLVDGVTCKANTGLSARALQQTSGLSVDNSEAAGALSDEAITEAEILAGRFDGALVRAFLVNWAAPEDWIEQFRGSFGEITRSGGAFKAELRGLSEALNQAQGLSYQPSCSAVLGDARCRFDTTLPGYFREGAVETVTDSRIFEFASFDGFDDRWFEHGRFEMITGEAAGLVGVVKNDQLNGTARRIELWQSLATTIMPGDMFRVIAGCGKSATTCRVKFNNFLNFRGFPHIPGEDWLASYPTADRSNAGGPRLPSIDA